VVHTVAIIHASHNDFCVGNFCSRAMACAQLAHMQLLYTHNKILHIRKKSYLEYIQLSGNSQFNFILILAHIYYAEIAIFTIEWETTI